MYNLGCQIFVQYIRMLYPGRFILVESVMSKPIDNPLLNCNAVEASAHSLYTAISFTFILQLSNDARRCQDGTNKTTHTKLNRKNVPLHSGRVHQGGGDKTIPKRLEGCSMDMLPHMVKKIKGHVCLYAYFSLFGLETHFITKFPYF